jgi:hypothetical protein
MIAITVSATKGFLHAWLQCLRGISSACSHHKEAHFIFSTDESKESEAAAELARRELPEGWKVSVLKFPFEEDEKDYKEAAQIRIAKLQGAGFAFAKKLRADQCLVVESDTILPANALRMMEWTLQMPDAEGNPYYDIAACTYPNGLFLGGFGTPQHQIAEDFLPSERKMKPRIKLVHDKCKDRLDAASHMIHKDFTHDQEKRKLILEKEGKRMARIMDRIKKSCPPDGNVWEINAKHGWRRRGWMDFAYPGIGEGAIVPSDWCGLGCTLLSKKALQLADFNGYEGKGTQDLFLCWHRWHPAGLKIACIPHSPCDHIKKQSDGKIVHYRSFHEQMGECKGHLRMKAQPFISL